MTTPDDARHDWLLYGAGGLAFGAVMGLLTDQLAFWLPMGVAIFSGFGAARARRRAARRERRDRPE